MNKKEMREIFKSMRPGIKELHEYISCIDISKEQILNARFKIFNIYRKNFTAEMNSLTSLRSPIVKRSVSEIFMLDAFKDYDDSSIIQMLLSRMYNDFSALLGKTSKSHRYSIADKNHKLASKSDERYLKIVEKHRIRRI